MKKIFSDSIAALQPREQQRFAILAIADVFISMVDISVMALLLITVNHYIQPSTASGLWLPAWISGENPSILLSVLLMLFIAKNSLAYFIHAWKYRFVYGVAARISEKNLLQYLEGSYKVYTSTDSSVHIRRISQQPVEFSHYVLSGLLQLFSESIMILVTITAILMFDAMLFLLLCAAMLPPIALIFFYTKKRLASVRKNIKKSSEQALQHLKESLAAYVESNLYNAHAFFSERYSHKQQLLNKYLSALQSVQVVPTRLMEVFAVVGLFCLIIFNNWTSGNSAIPLLTIGAFIAAAYKIIPGMVRLLNAGSQVRTYAFSAADLSWSTQRQQITDWPTSAPLHEIHLKNVSFDYDDKHLLQNVNLKVRQGELAGFSGISGKGKTTLINLLLGFLEPGNGQILFNRRVLDAAERQSCWKKISYVKQEPFLLHDTVLTNIVLSNSEVDEKQLQYAMRGAGLDSLIDTWPQGLNTVLSENGRNISGGQRQRVALARALYKNADLILLDEPFNELDEMAAADMLLELQNLASTGKMILLITHDTKTLSFCSKTISLDAA